MDANLLLAAFKIVDTFVRELKVNDFGLLEPYQIVAF